MFEHKIDGEKILLGFFLLMAFHWFVNSSFLYAIAYFTNDYGFSIWK